MAYRAIGVPTKRPSTIAVRPSSIAVRPSSITKWPSTLGSITLPTVLDGLEEGLSCTVTYVPPGAAPAEVKIYDGATLLATLTGAPWDATVATPLPGVHPIRAVVDGVSTATYAFLVPPTRPSVDVTLYGDPFEVGDVLQLLSTGDVVANTTKIEWYLWGVLVATDSTSTYQQNYDSTGHAVGNGFLVARRYYTGVGGVADTIDSTPLAANFIL